jgi:hypothetical protein
MRVCKLLSIFFLLLSLALISCGKKGDPFLPVVAEEGRVSILKGESNGENVDLTGRIQGAMREGSTLRAYYAAYPLDQPPCEGCPIEYQGFESFDRDSVSGDGFTCRITGIQPGTFTFSRPGSSVPRAGRGPPRTGFGWKCPDWKTRRRQKSGYRRQPSRRPLR